MKHCHWTTEDRKKVLWADESEFEIFGPSCKISVRHRVGRRMVPQCVTSTVKHGGRSVMVWGCSAGSRVGDLYGVRGTLNQNGYHSVLQSHAVPSGMRLVGQGFILQQDNDPKQVQATPELPREKGTGCSSLACRRLKEVTDYGPPDLTLNLRASFRSLTGHWESSCGEWMIGTACQDKLGTNIWGFQCGVSVYN
ncbi:hypothetical protein MHYP_G00240620 [Metynnis hypsauchen]